MSVKNGVFAGAAALAITGGAIAMAVPAGAVTPPAVRAATFVTDRPDSGNGNLDPYWADDTMHRVMTITLTGGRAGAYTFTATLKDKGTFTAIKGKQTPNQAAPYAGEVIKSAVTGKMTGYADFSFTASKLPSAAPNAGVPAQENDHGQGPSDSTTYWYELAFPAGTIFGGTGIGAWSWTYDATVTTVTFLSVPGWPVPVFHVDRQQWIDAYNNDYGDQAGDGNITG